MGVTGLPSWVSAVHAPVVAPLEPLLLELELELLELLLLAVDPVLELLLLAVDPVLELLLLAVDPVLELLLLAVELKLAVEPVEPVSPALLPVEPLVSVELFPLQAAKPNNMTVMQKQRTMGPLG